jgi:endonuclease/exonuclease/phosphatase family metal-dependent hydrolase
LKKRYIVPILFLCFFLNSCIATSETVKIASFNIRIFSNKSRNDEELNYIANILQQYDFIAIQELRDEEVLRRVTTLLKNNGRSYSYEISDEVGRGVKERYAFLYDRDIVEVIEKGKLLNDINDDFIREPYYATFQAREFDFTIITIHVLFGESKDQRRKEVEKLARIYKEIQDSNSKEQDVILCGDFNFPPDDKGFDKLKAIPSMTFLIMSPKKTTISDTSLYDNFWFQENYTKEFTGECDVYMFDEIVFQNDDKSAKLAVSDHRPIWAVFDIKEPDDD